MTQIDQAKATREGEELDQDKLEAWLRDTLPELPGEIEIAQFPGGASNLTYMIRAGDTELVGDPMEMALLRARSESVSPGRNSWRVPLRQRIVAEFARIPTSRRRSFRGPWQRRRCLSP